MFPSVMIINILHKCASFLDPHLMYCLLMHVTMAAVRMI